MDQSENIEQRGITFNDEDNKIDLEINNEFNKEQEQVPIKTDLTQNILLPWDRFSYWTHAILVVTFDLELGQSLEVYIIFRYFLF